jgi:hypothetical protein
MSYKLRLMSCGLGIVGTGSCPPSGSVFFAAMIDYYLGIYEARMESQGAG